VSNAADSANNVSQAVFVGHVSEELSNLKTNDTVDDQEAPIKMAIHAKFVMMHVVDEMVIVEDQVILVPNDL
jgi:hypothetical protein